MVRTKSPRVAILTGLILALSTVVARWPATQDALAQQGSTAVVIKGRAPVSTETLKVKLPRPVEADLLNGLHLMVLEDRRAPQVSFQLLIPDAGGYNDPPSSPGLASITAALMREGTASHTSQQIATQLETMASTVNVTAGLSTVVAQISGSSLTTGFESTLGLAAEILLTPTFPQEEITRYVARTKAGLIQQRTTPSFLASEMFSRLVYGSHPASRVSISPEVLDQVTRDALVGYHRSHFIPDRAVLAIAGDISMAEARQVVDAKLGAWPKAKTAAPAITDPGPLGPSKVSFIARPNSVQSTIWVGTQGISRSSPDYDQLTVMNAVIGGGPTGRLFTHLREEKGYTYGAYSNVVASQYRGNWLASMDVRTEVTEPALRDLMAEIARMRNEPVPAKEFDDRKRGIIGAVALSLESPGAVLNNHITRYLYKLPLDYWDLLPVRIGAVTQAQVQAMAKKYLDPARLQIVVVGDPSKVATILKQFGTVDTYDTNGKLVGG